ncbi:MAG TPA: patatin-like phospholipase family protein [Hyphomicrobiales bacterium]|nr:patatin-like phospholipase family protein [Hyphomicrobiales bacterium]
MFDVLARLGRGTAGAADPDGDVAPPARLPKIGLVLGGGAARGWAHIGVLRALDKVGYKPDIIAGTSIGAVVGGCYAAGRLDELEDWARSLTRRRVFSLLDLSFTGTGILGGSRLRDALEKNLDGLDIEDLPMGYVAIATEIATGHEVWLTRGRLVEAMRASYALPGLLEPVRVGGRWLMDGAMVNPVPVSAARALGARMVIAVNLHADVYGRGAVVPSHGTDEDDIAAIGQWRARRETSLRDMRGRAALRRALHAHVDGAPGIPTVMNEAYNITQDRIARARLAGDPPDVAVLPKLGHVGLFEFHRAAEAIAIGAEAVERAIGDIVETARVLA